MSPQEYNETRRRLSLTHEALAALLAIEPQTSRLWAVVGRGGPDMRAVHALRLIEHIGVDEARRILNTPPRP